LEKEYNDFIETLNSNKKDWTWNLN
jgi:hypothetical protein